MSVSKRINSKIDEVTANIQFHKIGGFKIEEVKILEIPKQWENFLNTEDTWCEVPYPIDADLTGAMYRGKEGSIFKAHRHPKRYEIFTVLNEEGVVHCVTPTWQRTIRFGESVYFDINEPHACQFLGKGFTLINIVWHPKMNGWEAENLK